MLCLYFLRFVFFFFKQKTAYEMRISDWSSDVCSSDLFAFVRWTSNDYGTVHSSIAIATAVAADAPYATLAFVRPGADLLLRIDGWPKVKQVLLAIDAVEATGIEACDAAPDHWRHVGNRLAAGMPFRPYGPDRHAAWLRRRAIEA